MGYYATFRRRDSEWSKTITFESKEYVKETMEACALGRDYIIAESERELEEKKKWRYEEGSQSQ